MKNKIIFAILGALFLNACNQKEMKISRAAYSVETEMTDFSPAYISKNNEGIVELNKNNLIGNTDWIISADRDLTLNEIAPFLKELTHKKYQKEGMHPDFKAIYFVYSDTLNKQNAYVKLPFKKFNLTKPSESEIDCIFPLNGSTTIDWTQLELACFIVFDKKMKVEGFINNLIEMEKQKVSSKVNEEVFVY